MRGIAVAAALAVLLGGGAAGAQGGVSAGEVRQAIFPRANAATRELGLRDEENRPLYLASFEWARWPKMAAGIYVALAVATTERGVGPGVGCDRHRTAVPGGVVLAVVRRETVGGRKKLKKLKVVAQDTRPVLLGCADGAATDSITMEAGAYPLSDVEQAVAVRRRTTSPAGTTEEIRLYRFGWELRVVLETEHTLRDREREYRVALEPVRKGRAPFEYVKRITARPVPHRARVASPPASETQPATQPASRPARPATTSFRWNGTRYVPAK